MSQPGPERQTRERGRVWRTLGEVGDRDGGSKIEAIRDRGQRDVNGFFAIERTKEDGGGS